MQRQRSDADEGWHQGEGQAFLRRFGIREGDRVLDFGCGPGGYVLPLAEVVGPTGEVLAVDRDRGHIENLTTRVDASAYGDIIDVRRTDGSLTLDWIDDGALDAVLLFDVLQHIPEWEDLFHAVDRSLKPGGLLLVNPSHLSHPGHVDIEALQDELVSCGFTYVRSERAFVMHFDQLLEEEILVYAAR